MSEEKKDFLPEMTKETITNVAKTVNLVSQELTITKVNGDCPYGHKEGEKHIITSTNHDGICGGLWQANHPSIASFHYGGDVCWGKQPGIFTGVCPEMGKVEMEVSKLDKKKAGQKPGRTGKFRDMTGKGYPGIDKYRVFLEVMDIAHHCMYGLKPGRKYEIDLFNMGEVCGFLYWGAYFSLQVLFSGGSLPWEPEKNMVHGCCPDIYSLVSYTLTREER